MQLLSSSVRRESWAGAVLLNYGCTTESLGSLEPASISRFLIYVLLGEEGLAWVAVKAL